MEKIIKANIRSLKVTYESTSFPLGYRTECTTILEIDDALPIDISRPIFISQDQDD